MNSIHQEAMYQQGAMFQQEVICQQGVIYQRGVKHTNLEIWNLPLLTIIYHLEPQEHLGLQEPQEHQEHQEHQRVLPKCHKQLEYMV